MAQILYSLVAGSDTMLIEANTGATSNKYVRASRKILKKIARGELRRPDGMATLLSGSYAYNYIHGCEPEDRIPSLEPLVFLCVTEALPYAATPSETREAAFTYLTSVRRSFLEQFRGDLDVICKYNPTQSDSGSVDSSMLIEIDTQMRTDLSRFSSYMKDQMASFAEDGQMDDLDEMHNFDGIETKQSEATDENGLTDMRSGPPPSGHPVYKPASGSKINKIISQIEQVKDSVRDNIDMVIDRGEELSLLQSKAENVNDQSMSFRQRSRRVHLRYCRDLYRQRCVMVFVAILILYLISAMICGWSWDSCGN